MRISKLEVYNFRNYRHLQLTLSDNRNVFLGRNAQGKTNLLESIYFLSHLSSARTPRLSDLVRNGEREASVRGLIINEGSELRLRAVLGSTGRGVEVNGRKLEKISRAKGLLKCVMFSPDDLQIVKGGPAGRRAFMDETMEMTDPSGVEMLKRYRHVLNQRNAILRQSSIHAGRLDSVIKPWDRQMVDVGSRLVMARYSMTENIKKTVGRLYREVSGTEEEFSLCYRGTFEFGEPNLEAISQGMSRALEASAQEERSSGSTAVGPHRDEIELRLGSRNARFCASQGEQRTMAYCMRMAQKEYIESETGEVPVLLLDDVLSELDRKRRASVVDISGRKSQVLMTTTGKASSKPTEGNRIFVVEKGTVRDA